MENLKINAAALLKVAPLAAGAAAAFNAVLFLIGNALGLMDPSVGIAGPDGSIQAITLVPVIMASIIPSLLAGVLLAVLNRFSAQPLRIFGIVTLVLLVLSMANPFLGIPNVPMGMALWLDLMHLMVAGTVWYAFSRYTKE